MNRFILSILTFSFQLQIFGQLFPLSDHYVFNPLVINPAFAGCQNALSASIFYRNQWVGFKDSPKNYILSVHSPVYNDKIGLGLLIEENSIGIFKETSIMANYAYRIQLYDGKLALGIGFGAQIHDIAWNDLDAIDSDDVQLMNNSTTAVLPVFSLGSYYYTKKYFIGFSLPFFIKHELDHSTGKYKIENDFSSYNYFITGGYEISIGPKVKLLPSLLIKYHPDNAIQMDINSQVNLRDCLWLGIGYRNRNMIVGIFQCQINDQLKLSYTYDHSLGDIGKYLNGSHEIVLTYVFSYTRKVMGPRQF